MGDAAARRARWAHRRWGVGGSAFHSSLLRLRGGGGLLPPLGAFHGIAAAEHSLRNAAKREAFARAEHAYGTR